MSRLRDNDDNDDEQSKQGERALGEGRQGRAPVSLGMLLMHTILGSDGAVGLLIQPSWVGSALQDFRRLHDMFEEMTRRFGDLG